MVLETKLGPYMGSVIVTTPTQPQSNMTLVGLDTKRTLQTGRFLGTFGTDTNCHSDICSYHEYLSCY